MYLPQVIRSAMVMKKAVSVLEPLINKQINAKTKTNSDYASSDIKIVLATVKGDVHDIGKNIAGIVLGCSGYKIVDLGVMVPPDKIIETAIQEKAALIGLSALISPSLDEMIHVAQEMEKRRLQIPLLISGAAANQTHTALRIAPEYSGPVIYIPDAASAVPVVRALLSNNERPGFLESVGEKYREITINRQTGKSRQIIISLQEARANKTLCDNTKFIFNNGIMDLNNYPIEKIIPFIDWQPFLQTWEIAEKSYPGSLDPKNRKKHIRNKLLKDARAMLDRVRLEYLLHLRGAAGFFPARANGDDIAIFGNTGDEIARFCFLRNQEKKQSGASNPCLSDFIAADMHLGFFALSAGFGLQEATEIFYHQNDDYSAILLASLANTLTEAFAAELHSRLKPDNFSGIRPAFGYPISPDHEDKRIVFKLLDAENRCGFRLTETAMMIPAASVCGMLIFHPAAYYFSVGTIGEDQIKDWAGRKNISLDDAYRRIGAGVPV
jgi:5-methyltetrahydrofolate--homocysteine methyltransferase